MAPELQDRPIELVTPPEELCRAQAVVQELSDRYCDLFDFAQVGYFVLDEHGQILAVNLAGAVLLGQERRNLVKQRLGQFIVLEDRAAFAGFWEQTLKTDRRQVGEFRFRKGEQTVHVQVRATSVATSGANAKRFR